MVASNYQLNPYEILPDRVLVYIWPPAGGIDLKFRFSLRYALDALTVHSAAYDYFELRSATHPLHYSLIHHGKPKSAETTEALSRAKQFLRIRRIER